MNIDVNVSYARAANEQLPTIANRVSNVKDNVLRLRSSIDARVLDCANLRARLRNTQNNIETIENDLHFLYRTVSQNITSYEENEVRVNNRVQSVPIKSGK